MKKGKEKTKNKKNFLEIQSQAIFSPILFMKKKSKFQKKKQKQKIQSKQRKDNLFTELIRVDGRDSDGTESEEEAILILFVLK